MSAGCCSPLFETHFKVLPIFRQIFLLKDKKCNHFQNYSVSEPVNQVSQASGRRVSALAKLGWQYFPAVTVASLQMESGDFTPWSRKHDDLVRLAGIEPTTLGFGGQYSIH